MATMATMAREKSHLGYDLTKLCRMRNVEEGLPRERLGGAATLPTYIYCYHSIAGSGAPFRHDRGSPFLAVPKGLYVRYFSSVAGSGPLDACGLI